MFRQNDIDHKKILRQSARSLVAAAGGARSLRRFFFLAAPRSMRGAERRKALVRKSAAPVARLAVGPAPSTEGSRRSMTPTGAPFGAPPRCFREAWPHTPRAVLAIRTTDAFIRMVQQAPCARVVVPVGRGPEAPRESGWMGRTRRHRSCFCQMVPTGWAPQTSRMTERIKNIWRESTPRSGGRGS